MFVLWIERAGRDFRAGWAVASTYADEAGSG